MPLPKPRSDEGKDEFISRCMGDEIVNTEYPEQNQRAAVCNSQWKEKFLDIRDVLTDEYDEVHDIEIFNIHPNAHKIKFKESDLDEMVDSFYRNEQSKRPNVKLSHSDKQLLMRELFNVEGVPFDEELPNIGYLYNLRKRGASLIADIKDIPKKLKDKVYNGKLFKTISPEIVFNHRGTGKKFLQAIVLTNNPSLKHIADVHMSEALGYGGNFVIEEGKTMEGKDAKEQEGVQLSEDSAKSLIEKMTEAVSGAISGVFKKPEKPPVDGEKVVTMAEIEGIKDSIRAEFKSEYEGQINELKAKLIDKENEQKNFSEQLKKIEENSRKEAAEAICKSAILDGVPPVVVNHFKPVLLSDVGERMIKFSDTVDGEIVEAEKSLNDFVVGFFDVYPSKVDLSDQTVTSLTAPSDDKYKKVNARAKELQDGGMDRHKALIQAGQELM